MAWQRSEYSFETQSKRGGIDGERAQQLEAYELVPKLFDNPHAMSDKVSRAAGMNNTLPSAKSTFTAARLNDIEHQFENFTSFNDTKTSRTRTTAALKPQVIHCPKNIDQLLVRQKNNESKRLLLSHRDLIESFERNPSKAILSSRTSHMNANVQLNITENVRTQPSAFNASDTAFFGKSTKAVTRPQTSKKQAQSLQKRGPKSIRERVVENRYKQRQALFQNKHNTAA